MGLNATRYPKPPMRIQFGIWHDAIANDWAGQDTNINFNAQPAVKFEYIRVLPADCAGGGLEGAFARFDQQQQQQQSNSSSSSSSSSSINNNTNNKNSTYNGDTGGGGNSSTAKNDGNCRNRVEALSLIICSLAAFIPLL